MDNQKYIEAVSETQRDEDPTEMETTQEDVVIDSSKDESKNEEIDFSA